MYGYTYNTEKSFQTSSIHSSISQRYANLINMRSNIFTHSSKSRWYMLQAFCTRRAMVKSLIMHAFHQRFYISHSYFLNICHKLHFNRHVDLICTEVRRVVWASRPMCSIYATVYEIVLCVCARACNTTRRRH